MHLFKNLFILVLIIVFVSPSLGLADESDVIAQLKAEFVQMRSKLNALEQKVEDQQLALNQHKESKAAYERRIAELEQQIASSHSPKPVEQAKNKKIIPDIGVVIDTVATLNSSKEDEEGADRFSVREVELVLGSDVDPYSRADATLAFSDFEDPSLEEAYLTRYGLPLGTTARIGKFKPIVGKAIPVHRDSLDTVDEPMVIAKYFGVEGYAKSGVDFSKNIDLKWPVSHQFNVGILEGGNGEEGTAFGDTRRRPTLYSHLKNYIDLSPETGFELGASHMIGSRDEDSEFEVQVLAADATLKHHLNPRQRIKLQGEVYNLNRTGSYLDVEEDDGLGGTVVNRYKVDGNLWGSYGLLDFAFHPQWSTGFRYDYVQLVDNPLENPKNYDQGYNGYLTFHQSEFARWRVQMSHQKLATGKDDNAVYLQGTFAIGTHKHKIQ